MESQVSPKNIEERVEAMAVAEKAAAEPEVKVPEPEVKPDTKTEVKVEPKVDAKAEPEVKPEPKAEAKPEKEKKAPNDPAELRKWATKSSQEAAALREELKAVKAAIEKLGKKPVDYAALAKDPDALKKHVEQERAEAAAELQTKLVDANNRALRNETLVARAEFEKDTENYPRWNKLFPLIQNLAANSDGRIKFTDRPAADVLHDLYILADQLSPSDAPAAVVPPVPAPAAVVPAAPAVTEEQIQARIAEAVAKAKADAEAGIRAEQNGAGVGSTGKGGRRDSGVSKDAFLKMDRQKLKEFIQKQS